MFWTPNVAEEVKKFVFWLWDILQQLLGTESTFINLPIARYFIGNAAGLAFQLVFYVFVLMLCVALVVRRVRKDAAVSFINVILAIAVIPAIIAVAEGALVLGNQFEKFVLELDNLPTPDDTSGDIDAISLSFSTIDQAIVTLFFALLLAAAGLQLLFLMVAYEFLNVLLIVAGVLVYSVSGFGENTRKLFSLIISMFIVTGVIGMPIIMLVTQLAQGLSDGLFGDSNPTGSIILLFIAAFIGICSQPLLVYYLYKRADRVMGNVIAKVNDKLRTVSENKGRLQAHLAGAERTTMSYRFRESIANTTNAQIDKFDAWKGAKAALATKRISEAAQRFKNPTLPTSDNTDRGDKALAAASAVAATGAVAAKVIPHPAARAAVTVGSSALTGIIRKAGNARTPRVRA